MIEKFFAPNHEEMAAAVRELGPGIFRKLTQSKTIDRLIPLSRECVRISINRPVDRVRVIEWSDYNQGIEAGAFSGPELKVVKYLRKYHLRLGERVGSLEFASIQDLYTQPYAVIAESDLTGYKGESRYPANKGGKMDKAGAVLLGIIIGFLLGVVSCCMLAEHGVPGAAVIVISLAVAVLTGRLFGDLCYQSSLANSYDLEL